MAMFGAQRMVLQAAMTAQGKKDKPATDTQISQITHIGLKDVRDWLLTLMKDGYIDLVRTETGYAATVNERGRLELALYQPFPSEGQTETRYGKASSQRTILLLAANPKGTQALRLDKEAREIERSLERTKKRASFRLIMKWAVEANDLQRALLEYEPEIVHFSGHGSGVNSISLLDEGGFVHEITGGALSRIFKLFTTKIKCVILSACYSVSQAAAISKHIDYVIGMKQAIGDEAAIEFAVGFYNALGTGRDVETAFELGVNAIQLSGIPEDLTPVLKKHL